jgi:voltage-gated potassium channel
VNKSTAGEQLPSPYQLFMLVLSVFVLLYLAADAFLPLDPEIRRILLRIDFAICFIFLADFIHSMATARNRARYFFTWGWIDLISSIPAVPYLRWGRAARVTRILRLLRGLRSTRTLVSYALGRRAQSAFLAAILAALLSAFFASVAVLQVERAAGGTIDSGADALWWTVVTMTAVGYGDYVPVTTEGRLIAAGLMLIGIALFGTFTALMATWFLAPGEREQEKELEAIRRELSAIRRFLGR